MSAPLPAPLPRLQLSVLGGFELSIDDQPQVVSATGEKLLAYLVIRARVRPVRRAALAEELWADTDPVRASARLRSALWRLPRPNGYPLVRGMASGLQLTAGIVVDLWRAEDAARTTTIMADVVAANGQGQDGYEPIHHLSGELLPGWSEEWLVIERECFHQVKLHALEQISARLLRRGCYAGALQAAFAAIQCEPLRESAQRQVIEVHLAEGNKAEALRQYWKFKKLLAAELGLDPSASIQHLVCPLLGTHQIQRKP